MSRLQRRLLAAVGILSLVVAVAAVVVSNREPGRRGAVLSASAQEDGADDVEPSTTDRLGTAAAGGLEPVRGGTALPPTTPPAPPPTPLTEPPATTTTAPPPALEARGSFFGPPSDTSVRTAAGGDCRTMASATWSIDSCGTVTSAGGPITWLIETKSKGWRVLLLKPAGVAQWSPHLAASDDTGTRWTAIKARVADGPGGTNDQVLGVGFSVRTGSSLAVDLIQRGQVVAHTDLAKGAARLSRAQLDTWAAQADGSYLHQIVRWRSDAWRVVETEKVPASLVPPSHL